MLFFLFIRAQLYVVQHSRDASTHSTRLRRALTFIASKGLLLTVKAISLKRVMTFFFK